MGFNIFDLGHVMMHGVKNMGRTSLKYDVYESSTPIVMQDGIGDPVEPNNMLTVFTAAKILSSSISQLDLQILKESEDYPEFRHYYNLRFRMNDVQNNQVFWSTLEYHRSIYGNAFVDLRKGRNEIIHPSIVTDYDFKGNGKGGLRFKIEWSLAGDNILDKRHTRRSDEWINNKDLLHFKGISVDGVFGLPPVSAAMQAMQIMDKASNTVISFYNNRALSPMALESTINTAAGAKATLEGAQRFNTKYTGTYNAGKIMQLPPNTKLNPIAIQFKDAELVATMRFTKEEIYTMYGIPTFMYSNTETIQTDIEQQTLSFKTFTLSPITSVYEEEIKYKMLNKEDLMEGINIRMNMDALLEADMAAKATAFRSLTTAGIITPNEATKEMGFKESENPNMDKHYLQVQNEAIESYTPGWGRIDGTQNKVDEEGNNL